MCTHIDTFVSVATAIDEAGLVSVGYRLESVCNGLGVVGLNLLFAICSGVIFCCYFISGHGY